MAELTFTAYDIQGYLREALPALRAAIYRGDLSQAKDVLTLYDETIYGEYDLSLTLVENDYSWIFTEASAAPEVHDPQGELIGLTYPLILAYHHADVFHAIIGGSEVETIFPFIRNVSAGIGPAEEQSLAVQSGFREGLRALWEIVGYLTPAGTIALRQYCLDAIAEGAPPRSSGAKRTLSGFANGLNAVIERGYGLVLERD